MSDLERRLAAIAGDDEWTRHRELDTLRATGLRTEQISDLVTTLREDDAGRRSAARMALAALAAPDSVCRDEAQAVLREALTATDSDTRVLAASALGEAGDPGGGEPLTRALDDRDTNVQAAAADALGTLRHAPALDALADLSRTEDLWVRAAAIVALGRLRDERAVPVLARLADPPGLERAIAEAIARIGHPAGLDLLHGLYERVPEEALRAAGGITSAHPDLPPPEWVREAARQHEAALRHQLVETDDPITARLLGLAGSGEAIDNLVSLVGPPRRSEAAIAGLLAAPPEPRVDAILERLPHADLREAETLLSVLPPLHDPDRVRALVPFLGHDAPAVRAAAAEAMARAPTSEALPLLEAELQRESVAPEVVQAIGALGTAACTALLPLLEDPEAPVRAAAASALGRCAESTVESDLRAALASETDRAAREALLLALARTAGPGALDALLGALDSGQPGTRLAAIEAFGFVGHTSAIPPLERALEGPMAERLAALRALGRMAEPEVAPLLEAHLAADELDVRRTAAAAAVRLAAPLGPALAERMAGDDDPWIRTCAARVLARGGPGARDRLERMAGEDPDAEVRSVARTVLAAGR